MDKVMTLEKLESLHRCLARIRQRCPSDATALTLDLDAQDILALNLTRAVQLCVDISTHWLAHLPHLPAPGTMGEAFQILAQGGYLAPDLAISLRKAVGFRNLAVHHYTTINWEMVTSLCIHRLGDFEAFSRQVLAALDHAPS